VDTLGPAPLGEGNDSISSAFTAAAFNHKRQLELAQRQTSLKSVKNAEK
jgi:hypothetical protein